MCGVYLLIEILLVRCRTSWGEPEQEVRTQVAGRQAGRQHACTQGDMYNYT